MQTRRLFVSMVGLSLALGANTKAEARTLSLDAKFSSSQANILKTAFATAESMAQESYNSLSAVPTYATMERVYSPRFQRAAYNGSYSTMSTADWDTFAANFLTLYQAIRDKTFTVISGGTDCDSSTAAYMNFQGIHICTYFWQLKTQKPYGFSSQAGAILHEISHMSDVLKTGDNDSSLPNVGLKTSYTYHRFAENDPTLSIVASGTKVLFNGTDTMRNDARSDWDWGFWKGDCKDNEVLSGISVSQQGNFGHAAVCKRDQKTGTYMATLSQPGDQRRMQRSVNGTTDWDYGFYKLECGQGERMSGVSQTCSNTPAFHAIRCSSGFFTDYNCETRQIGGGDSRSSVLTEDWDPSYFKAECSPGKVAVGVSVDSSTGRLHKLLCCQEYGAV